MRNVAFGIIWFFVFVIPWENFYVLPAFGTMGRVAGLAAFVVTLTAIVIWRENLRIRWMHWVFLLFVLWCAASFFWSIDPETSYGRIKTYLQLFLMVFVVFQWAEEERKMFALLEAFVLGCWVAILSTLKNFYFGGLEDWQRIAASGFNPNDMAIIIALGIPMAWYLGLKLTARRGWLYRLYPFVAPVAVALTASRGGLIIMLIAMLFVVCTFQKVSTRGKVLFVAAWLSVLVVGYQLVPAESLQRWATIGTEITQGSLNSRLYIWEAGLKVFSNNPILGVGAGAFRTGVIRQLGRAIAPHNVYLSILVEQGLIGLGIFLTMLGMFLWKILQMRGLERLLLIFLLGMWMVGALSLNWEWRKQTWILFTLILAHMDHFRTEPEVLPSGELKPVA